MNCVLTKLSKFNLTFITGILIIILFHFPYGLLFKQTQTEFSWNEEWECELHSGVEWVDARSRGMHDGIKDKQKNIPACLEWAAQLTKY